MLRSSFLFVLLLLTTRAFAEPEFCRTAYCDPGNGIWYPRDPEGAPYGRDVQLGSDGEWIDRSGYRSWSPRSHARSNVLSEANSDERNGELAYQTAYDSFMEGKFNGGNRVEHLPRGRWNTRITTPDGIVLYKDAARNVAVQSPDGKWHITNGRGQYASTTLELETRAPAKAMVAKKVVKKKALVAKAARKARKAVAKAVPKEPSRKLASVEPPAAEPAPPAEAAAPAVAEAANAAKVPAAAEVKKEAEKAGEEPLLPMDQLAKLAQAKPAPAAEAQPAPAKAAAPATAKPAAAK